MNASKLPTFTVIECPNNAQLVLKYAIERIFPSSIHPSTLTCVDDKQKFYKFTDQYNDWISEFENSGHEYICSEVCSSYQPFGIIGRICPACQRGIGCASRFEFICIWIWKSCNDRNLCIN